jgi:hypothetical protein
MLEKLLDRVSKGGIFSTQSLAQELGVSKELVEAMILDLSRAGYIRPVEPCLEGECGRCLTATICKPWQKVWMLVKHDCL